MALQGQKASVILHLIRQSLGSRLRERFFLVALVKRHLECCAQVWAPQHQRGMEIPEGAKQRATALIKGLENLL